jgi:hypothetical protein
MHIHARHNVFNLFQEFGYKFINFAYDQQRTYSHVVYKVYIILTYLYTHWNHRSHSIKLSQDL